MTSISHCGDREVDVGVLARQGFHHAGVPGVPQSSGATSPPRPVFLIVDGHPVHQGGRSRLGARSDCRVRLDSLPSYSPELNPDELLNHDVKAYVGRHRPRNNLIPRAFRAAESAGIKTALSDGTGGFPVARGQSLMVD